MNMDNTINDSNNEPVENANGITENTDTLNSVKKKMTKEELRAFRIANLKPFKKGEKRPKGSGKPKGYKSLKSRLLRLMEKDGADKIAKTLYKMCIEGNVAALKLFAELTGELLPPSQQVNITNNTALLGDDMIARAREYALASTAKPLLDAVIVENTGSNTTDASPAPTPTSASFNSSNTPIA